MLTHLSFGTVIETIYNNGWVRFAVALIVADVVSGVALALYNRDFRLAQVSEFLVTRAIPYLLGAGVVQLVLLAAPLEYAGLMKGLEVAVWGFVVAALLGHVLDNLRQMGLPIPEVLGAKRKPEVKAGT
jgi:hypothetical protein